MPGPASVGRRWIAAIIVLLIVIAVWKIIDLRLQPPPPPPSAPARWYVAVDLGSFHTPKG